MINTEKRYCGLYSVEIKGLTCEQSELALRYLLDHQMDDRLNEQPIEFGFYRNEQTKELIFDSDCNMTDRITDWTVTVSMLDRSFGATTKIPWFAAKSITSMYLNFREKEKRFNQLIEDLLKAIDSERSISLFFFRIEITRHNERKVFYMNENNSRLSKETIDKLNEAIEILEEKIREEIREEIRSKTLNDLYKELCINTTSRLVSPHPYKSVDLTEFNKLCKMLSKNDIKFESKPRLGGMSLAIPNYETFSTAHDGNRTISVICFDGTYGSENGLLEIYAPGLNEGVEGHLTADEAFEYIEDTLEGKTRNSCG